MLHRSDLLLQLMNDYKTLAIAVTHEKTTTSALLAYVLIQAQLDPAFAVGGMLPQFQDRMPDMAMEIILLQKRMKATGLF